MDSKIEISTSKFVRWYFEDKLARTMLYKLRDELVKNGEYSVKTSKVFFECDAIPSSLREDYDRARHRNESYNPYDCKLV